MTTDLMEKGPYVTSVPRIRTKFPVFKQNRQVHYRVQSNPPPAPVSGQQSATHTLPSHIFIIVSSKRLIFFRSSPILHFSPCLPCVPHAPLIWRLDLIIAIISGKGENHKAMQYAIFSNLLSLLPSGSKHFQRHPVLLSKTLGLCYPPTVSPSFKSNPSADQITVPNTSVFMFWVRSIPDIIRS